MTSPAAILLPHTEMVVADAGPLIHLDELGCIGLLADFPVVRVPDAVWAEVMQHRPQALQCTEVRWLKCAPEASRQVAARPEGGQENYCTECWSYKNEPPYQ